MKNYNKTRVFETIIAKSIAAGQAKSIIPLGKVELGDKVQKCIIKRINADEGLLWDGYRTTTAMGVSVAGFAFWSGILATTVGLYTHRHRLLMLCRPDDCRGYAVPMCLIGKKFSLPDIALADFELDAYVRIADSVSSASIEHLINLSRPAKAAVKANRVEWHHEAINAEALGQLLGENADWLFAVLSAAIDAQLRSFAPCADVPVFVYNFTTRRPDSQAEKTFRSAFAALNLTVEGAACNSAPVEIIVQDSSDLAIWASCPGRLAILRAVTGAQLRSLFDQLDEFERYEKYGGVLPERLATVPIIRSRTFFDRADTVDIELPSAITPLTTRDLDLLRTVAACVLRKKIAAEVHRRWYERMSSKERYAINPFEVWREAILQAVLETNLSTHGSARNVAYTSWETAEQNRRRAEVEREETIQRAIDLLSDQSRFEQEIIKKPASVDEATQLLDEEQTAVAFLHAPVQGPDRGKHFIIFTHASLLRLLRRAGLRDELYDIFKKRAAENGLLVKQSKPVKIGKATLNGFWIVDQKF